MANIGWYIVRVILLSLAIQVIYLSLTPSFPEFENKTIYPIILVMILGCGGFCYSEVYLPYRKSVGREFYWKKLMENLKERKFTIFLVNLGRFSVYKNIEYERYLRAIHNRKNSPQKLQKELMALLLQDK